MTLIRFAWMCGIALGAAVPAFSQSAPGSCIVAGRLGMDGYWAPRFDSVQLLGADGQVLPTGGREALSAVKQVRLSAPALLSRCDGSSPLAQGPESPGPKTAVPAVGPGVVAVEAVNFPPLRTGGALVELRISVPADRVTLVSR